MFEFTCDLHDAGNKKKTIILLIFVELEIFLEYLIKAFPDKIALILKIVFFINSGQKPAPFFFIILCKSISFGTSLSLCASKVPSP